MSRFKKGDRVRCVTPPGSGAGWTVGKVYGEWVGDLLRDDDGDLRPVLAYDDDRFVLAAPAPVLDPFAWDVFALEPTVREATPYGYVDCIVAWSRFCYLAASLPLTVHPDPAPRTVMVELPVDVAVRRARRVTNVSSDIKAIRNACRAALEATYEP